MSRSYCIGHSPAFHFAAIFAMLTVVGCDSRPREVALPANAKTVDESQPMVPHPEYVNWSKFPVKSHVVRNRSVVNEHGKVTVRTKLWLESISDKGVTVSSQITVERPNEPVVVNPIDSVSYPASFRLPKGMKEEQFQLPCLKATATGNEELKVADRDFSTTVFVWDEVNETGPMSVKVWHSDAIPGRVVRQEFLIKSSQTATTEEVVEVHIAPDTKTSDANKS